MAADFLRAPGSGSSFFLETIAMRFFCTGYIFWINQHSKARLSHGDEKQDRNREGGGVRWAKQAVVGTTIPRWSQCQRLTPGNSQLTKYWVACMTKAVNFITTTPAAHLDGGPHVFKSICPLDTDEWVGARSSNVHKMEKWGGGLFVVIY